jgi:hypothetical protein
MSNYDIIHSVRINIHGSYLFNDYTTIGVDIPPQHVDTSSDKFGVVVRKVVVPYAFYNLPVGSKLFYTFDLVDVYETDIQPGNHSFISFAKALNDSFPQAHEFLRCWSYDKTTSRIIFSADQHPQTLDEVFFFTDDPYLSRHLGIQPYDNSPLSSQLATSRMALHFALLSPPPEPQATSGTCSMTPVTMLYLHCPDLPSIDFLSSPDFYSDFVTQSKFLCAIPVVVAPTTLIQFNNDLDTRPIVSSVNEVNRLRFSLYDNVNQFDPIEMRQPWTVEIDLVKIRLKKPHVDSIPALITTVANGFESLRRQQAVKEERERDNSLLEIIERNRVMFYLFATFLENVQKKKLVEDIFMSLDRVDTMDEVAKFKLNNIYNTLGYNTVQNRGWNVFQ